MRRKMKKTGNQRKRWIAVLLAIGMVFGVVGISSAQPDVPEITAGEEAAQAAAEPGGPEESNSPVENAEGTAGPDITAKQEQQPEAPKDAEPAAAPSAAALPIQREQQPMSVQEETAAGNQEAEQANALAEEHTNPDVLAVFIGTDPDHLEQVSSSFSSNTGSNIFYEFKPGTPMPITGDKVYLKIAAKDGYEGSIGGEAEVSFQTGNDSHNATIKPGEVFAFDAALFRSMEYGDYDMLQVTVSYAGVWVEKFIDNAFTWVQVDGSYTYKGYLKNLFQPSEQPGKSIDPAAYIGFYKSSDSNAPAIEIYQNGSTVSGRIVGELDRDGVQAGSGAAASSSLGSDGSEVVTLQIGYGVNAYFTVGADGTLTSKDNYAYRKTAGEEAGTYTGLIPSGTVYAKETARVILVSNGTQTPYFTIQEALHAAADGDTIELQAGTYTENVELTKAVTLTGPEAGQAVLTGGISLAGPFADDSQTIIRGLVFQTNGIYANSWGSQPNLNHIIIENNTFDGIAYTLPNCGAYSAIHFNLDPAKPVSNLTVQNNTITNVSGANASGITLSDVAGTTVIEGNTIDSVSLNCIQLPNNAEGSVSIRNNYLKNWDADIAGGGRAMRLGNMNAQVGINENSMVRTLAAGEDGAEIIKVTTAANKIDATKNYWNSAAPNFEACLNTAGRFDTKPYYSDEARTKLVEFVTKNERTGEEYETLQRAINKAENGDTILLGSDCEFGTTTQTGYDPDGVGYGLYGKFYKPLTIRSEGSLRTITMTSMFTVTADTTFENVAVEGGRSNSFVVKENATLTLGSGTTLQSLGSSGVQVGENMGTPGTLVMKKGATVTGNAKDGVKLMANGTFVMDGGTISSCNGDTSNKGGSGYGVIVSGGSFTMNGGSISGNSGFAGGGVQVSAGWDSAPATFVMNGGTITGNSGHGTTSASVAVMGAGCTFTMNGGSITDNTGGSNQATAGVAVTGESTFTMNGGEIAGNTAGLNNRSAALYMTKGTVVLQGTAKVIDNVSADSVARMPVAGIYMTGGSLTVTGQARVTGNTSPFDTGAGGIYISDGSLSISGGAQVTGNTKNGAPSNVVLSSGKLIDVTGIAADARIGVTPYRTTAGTGIAAADDAKWISAENFSLDTELSNGTSFIEADAQLVLGMETVTSAEKLAQTIFQGTGTAPGIVFQGLTVKTAAGAEITGAQTETVYFEDSNGQPGGQLSKPPVEPGVYWVRAAYAGDKTKFYGKSMSDAYSYQIVVMVESVTLNRTEITLRVGNKEQLIAGVSPENSYDKALAWSSSDASVASAENGTITALKAGKATVTAKAGNGKEAVCTVTVTEPAETDPVLPGTESKTPVIIEPEVKGNEPDAEMIKEAISRAASGDAVVVKIDAVHAADAKIGADVVGEAARAAARGGAESLVLAVTDENGKIISSVALDLGGVDPEKQLDVNFGFTNDVSDEIAQQAKTAVPEGANLLFIHLAHDGAFPCPVTRMDYVGGSFRPGSTVYLYWIDPSGGLSEEQELRVDENGYITYTISHASPYAVSDRRMTLAVVPDIPDDNGNNPGDKTEPGGVADPPAGGDAPADENPGEDDGQAGGNQEPEAGAAKKAAVKTDDETNVIPYLWLAAAMGAGIAGGTVFLKKRRQTDK